MKKALIFFGGWPGHFPVETSAVYKKMLEESGFEVIATDKFDILEDFETVKSFDLIVPNCTMGELSGSQCKNIVNAVAEGTGIAGCHGGMCDAFRNLPSWHFMTGAQWVAHPGGDKVTYKVNLMPDNPFTEGLEDFEVTEEQYYIHIDPAVKVHATTKFPVAEGNHASNGEVAVPVVFTKMWGKGKVFYSSLGHTEKTFDRKEVYEITKRGFVWAAR